MFFFLEMYHFNLKNSDVIFEILSSPVRQIYFSFAHECLHHISWKSIQ